MCLQRGMNLTADGKPTAVVKHRFLKNVIGLCPCPTDRGGSYGNMMGGGCALQQMEWIDSKDHSMLLILWMVLSASAQNNLSQQELLQYDERCIRFKISAMSRSGPTSINAIFYWKLIVHLLNAATAKFSVRHGNVYGIGNSPPSQTKHFLASQQNRSVAQHQSIVTISGWCWLFGKTVKVDCRGLILT